MCTYKDLALVCFSEWKIKIDDSPGPQETLHNCPTPHEVSWSPCVESAPLRWTRVILNICVIKQCWSYTTRPLAEAKLLTRSLISILMSLLAHRGKQGGRQGHKLPNFLFHFKTFHKGSKNMAQNRHISRLIRLWLPNVYSFRKMFTSLPCIFCVRASRLNSVRDRYKTEALDPTGRVAARAKTLHRESKYETYHLIMWCFYELYELTKLKLHRLLLDHSVYAFYHNVGCF